MPLDRRSLRTPTGQPFGYTWPEVAAMLSSFQKLMTEDIGGPNGYGQILVGWTGQSDFVKNTKAAAPLGPLVKDLVNTFVDGTYFLISTQRPVTLYRGFETTGLTAPYGKDHASFISQVLAKRNPGTPDGHWWSSRRPSASIDDLRLADLHRSEDRDSLAITLKMNRLDYYLEGSLPPGSLVYVGRAAPQQEDALFGRQLYCGGGMQFRLPLPPGRMLRDFKTHCAK